MSFEQKVILRAIDNVSKETAAINRNMSRHMKSIESNVRATKMETNGLRDSVLSVKTAVVGLTGYLTGKTTGALINTQRSIDRVNNSLEVATGNARRASAEFIFIETEAKRLNLDIKSLSLEYAQLSAATRETSLEGKDTREIFLATAEAATALGLSADDTKGALRAFQQMVSKGNVQAEELRGQLGERIPGAFNMSAKAMGLTTKELNKQLELGNVTASQMLPKLAAEMRKTYGGQAAQAAEEINGKINRLKNSVFEMQRKFLEAGGQEMLKNGFDKLSEGAEFITENMDKIIENLDLIISGGKVFLEVYATTKIIAIANSFGTLVTTITKLNPVIAAATASFAAIEGSIYLINREIEKLEGKKDALTNIADLTKMRELSKEWGRLNVEINEYESKITSAREEKRGAVLRQLTDEQTDKYKRIAEIRQEINNTMGEGFVNEKTNVERLTKNYGNLILNLQEESRVKKEIADNDDKARAAEIEAKKRAAALEAAEGKKKKGPRGAVVDYQQVMKEAAAERASLQYEIDEMLLSAQQEGRDKELEAEKLHFQQLTDIRLNEHAVNAEYMEAVQEQHRANIAKINDSWDKKEDQKKKEHAKKELAINNARIESQYAIASSYLGAGANIAKALKAQGGVIKAFALSESLIQIPRAYLQALTTFPGPPATYPQAFAAGADAAGKSAVIASQSFHTGGMVREVPARLLPNEGVLSRAGMRNLGGEGVLNSLNNGTPLPPANNVNIYYNPTNHINASAGENIIDILARDREAFGQLITDTQKRGYL